MGSIPTPVTEEIVLPNHMKFCGCRRCRTGMHTTTGGAVILRAIRKARRSAKQLLKRGKEPAPTISVEYTD